MRKADQTATLYESLQPNAIRVGGGWVEAMIKTYKEPSRAGTPKGQPIGLSKKKYRAALFMILYDGRNLKQIASLAGVSPGLLRLWRTEPAFLEESTGACNLFAVHLITTMDYWIYEHAKKVRDKITEKILAKYVNKVPHLTFKDFPYEYDPNDPLSMIGSLVDLLPFFNEAVLPVITIWFEKRLKEGSYLHSFLMFRVATGQPKNQKMLRKWEIKRLEMTKLLVQFKLTLLARAHNDTAEERQQMATSIQDFIFKIFDNLAGE